MQALIVPLGFVQKAQALLGQGDSEGNVSKDNTKAVKMSCCSFITCCLILKRKL